MNSKLDLSSKKKWGFVISYAAAHLIIPNGQRAGVAKNLTISEYEDMDIFGRFSDQHISSLQYFNQLLERILNLAF